MLFVLKITLKVTKFLSEDIYSKAITLYTNVVRKINTSPILFLFTYKCYTIIAPLEVADDATK